MSKEIKTNAMRKLDSLNIKYELVDYDLHGKFSSAADIQDHVDGDGSYIFKTLATLSNTGEIIVFVIGGSDNLDFKKASKACGVKKLEMLHVNELKNKIGYERGATTALAMKKDYRVVIDNKAIDKDYIGISAGAIGYGLKVNAHDLAKANGAEFADVIQ